MAMKQKKRGRGRPGFEGTRVILHLTPQQMAELEKHQREKGTTRAELIRRAIDAYFFKKRREIDVEPPKQ